MRQSQVSPLGREWCRIIGMERWDESQRNLEGARLSPPENEFLGTGANFIGAIMSFRLAVMARRTVSL